MSQEFLSILILHLARVNPPLCDSTVLFPQSYKKLSCNCELFNYLPLTVNFEVLKGRVLVCIYVPWSSFGSWFEALFIELGKIRMLEQLWQQTKEGRGGRNMEGG